MRKILFTALAFLAILSLNSCHETEVNPDHSATQKLSVSKLSKNSVTAADASSQW